MVNLNLNNVFKYTLFFFDVTTKCFLSMLSFQTKPGGFSLSDHEGVLGYWATLQSDQKQLELVLVFDSFPDH